MTVKEILVQDLGAVLEETGNLMVDKMVLESLAKNGSVSLEEAEFFNALVRRVVTEAAEEFVPDELSTAGGETMTLTGEDGTVYTFNTGTKELTPIEGTGGADDESAAMENPGVGVESEELGQDAVVESTEISVGATELTESQMIVSNLIKSLGA